MNLIQNEKGFSLIEIVVAGVILAAVLVPMLFTLLKSHNVVYQGQDYMTANNLIMQAAEELKANPFTDAELNNTGLNPVEVLNYQGSKFTFSKVVTDVVPGQLKRVDLAIKDGPKFLTKVSFILYQKGI